MRSFRMYPLSYSRKGSTQQSLNQGTVCTVSVNGTFRKSANQLLRPYSRSYEQELLLRLLLQGC